MADTRILPKAQPRSTGIPRITTQPTRPATGGSSAVSTAAGVGREIHDYVHSGRGQQQPPARSRMDQSQATPTNQAAPRGPAARPTAAAVVIAAVAAPGQPTGELATAPAASPTQATQTFPAQAPQPGARPVQRLVSGGGQSQAAQRPAVQLIDRAKSAGAAPSAPPFTIEQMMIMAHLLENFADGEAAVAKAPGLGKASQSQINADAAYGALAVLSRMMNTTYAPAGAHVEIAPEPVVATTAAPTVTIVAAPSAAAKSAAVDVVTSAAPVSPATNPAATPNTIVADAATKAP